jgi:hypothetical protein
MVISSSEEQTACMRALAAAVTPYWAGEAEIARVYFSRPRTLAQDLYWLTAQARKEMLPLNELPDDLIEELWATGSITRHPCGDRAAEHTIQEFRHFRLLADLVCELSGTRLTLADFTQLPEDEKLQSMRARYRRCGPLACAAVAFTEGGGGALYRVVSQLDGGRLERRLAEIFSIIHAEEIEHGPMEIYSIALHAVSATDWETATAIVCDLSRQRLLMRNEMFGYPLSTGRLTEIGAGLIDPWEMPIAL